MWWAICLGQFLDFYLDGSGMTPLRKGYAGQANRNDEMIDCHVVPPPTSLKLPPFAKATEWNGERHGRNDNKQNDRLPCPCQLTDPRNDKILEFDFRTIGRISSIDEILPINYF